VAFSFSDAIGGKFHRSTIIEAFSLENPLRLLDINIGIIEYLGNMRICESNPN
jgi:hypothetical protein